MVESSALAGGASDSPCAWHWCMVYVQASSMAKMTGSAGSSTTRTDRPMPGAMTYPSITAPRVERATVSMRSLRQLLYLPEIAARANVDRGLHTITCILAP